MHELRMQISIQQDKASKMRSARKMISALLMAQVALLLLAGQQQQLVQCSSSYIDDYFLPGAKIAFNKIQQQFTPSINIAASSLVTGGEQASATATTPQTTTTTTSEISEQRLEEPSKGDFVNLHVARPLAPTGDEQAKRDDLQQQSAAGTAISSTESVSEDPTTTVVSEDSQPSASQEIAQNHAEIGATSEVTTSTTTAATTTTTTTTTATQTVNEEPVISNQIDGKLEAVRATELEAIAAVDASIGFGEAAGVFGAGAPTDACYDEYGNARYCEPEFENVAFERQVEVSSECGAPPSRFCTAYLNEHGGDQIRNCHICDQQHPKKRHPAAYLTDINNANQPTCWVSAPISARSTLTDETSGQSAASASVQRDNVTLTLHLNKRYEITYLSMQFCSLKPDSLSIWRSQDFGATWSAYQYYSSHCERFYGKPTTEAVAGPNGGGGPLEASCVNSSSSSSGGGGGGQLNGRIAFSTLDSLEASGANNSSAQLHDWMSATDIRIVLDQHQASWIQSSLAYARHRRTNANLMAAPTRTQQEVNNDNNTSQSIAALESPSDTYNYAISDLTVGGRCKCNGHASRCVHNQEGRLQCDCQHNTDGPDCERCLPLHHDRPWQRATQLNANPCQPCNCNGHSRKCRFDSELYQLSGRRSGGVCTDCKDNTTGRHCHYCKEGWTRDHTRPMSDKEACKPCDCHPVGSVGRVCNQTSGQCPCKEGVTGLECNRCAPGYQQSSSPSEPCIKLPENDINYEPSIEEQPASPVVATPAPDQTSAGEPSIASAADEDPSIVAQAPVQPAAKAARPDELTGAAAAAASLDEMPPASTDDQSEPMLPPPPTSAGRHRHQQQQQPASHRNPWRPYGGARNTYYSNKANKNHHKPHFEPIDSESYGDESYELDEQQYQASAAAAARHHQLYGQVAGYSNKRAGGFVPADAYRGRGRAQQFGSPLASLDNEQPDEFAAAGQDELANPYGPAPLPTHPLYVDDSSAYNQIQGGNLARNSHNQRGAAASTHHLQHANMLRSRQQQQQQAARNTAIAPPSGPIADVRPSSASTNSLACADCQPAMRRLNFKQFCHLDYVIKATVLRKHMADDWTRFEVEIQDIFKSPSSSSLLLRRNERNFVTDVGAATTTNGQKVSQLSESAQNKIVSELVQDQALQAASGPHRSLKVGGLQSIWIPTEDVACKCPRLKLRSTYLLMGLVDAKENSATSIQLDRHGVALEWKSSLQEKLNSLDFQMSFLVEALKRQAHNSKNLPKGEKSIKTHQLATGFKLYGRRRGAH